METGSCYAGSHDGDELVLSCGQGQAEVKPLKHLSGQVCQICGDDVGLTTDGDLFVACNVCAFPVCRPCYEYERKDGNQSCPQCKTRYKMLKGSARVEGDDGEEGAEDLGNEYHYPPPGSRNEKKKIAEAILRWKMSYGRGEDVGAPTSTRQEVSESQIPRLTNGKLISGELPALSPLLSILFVPHLLVVVVSSVFILYHTRMLLVQISGELPALSPGHSLRASPSSGGGIKRVHPLPYTDATRPAQVRIVDHSRDFSSYGFGNLAWKERVESWKNKQEKNMLQVTNSGDYASEGKGGDVDFVSGENEDLQMNDEARQPLSRKVSIPSSKINPYRMVIVIRLVVLCIFFRYISKYLCLLPIHADS